MARGGIRARSPPPLAEFFAGPGEIAQRPSCVSTTSSDSHTFRACPDCALLAHSLPDEVEGKAVLRIAVLSIVLALAARPSATPLCSAWCDRPSAPPFAADRSCHHNNAVPAASPGVAGDDACESLVLEGSAFIREETRPLVSPSPGQGAVLIARHLLPTPTACQAFNGSGDWAFDNQPPSTALRI